MDDHDEFDTRLLLKFNGQTKAITKWGGEGDKGFSDIPVGSLTFRYISGIKSWGTFKGSWPGN